MKRIKDWYNKISLKLKLVFLFIVFAVVILVFNLLLFRQINNLNGRLDSVYSSNISLNELDNTLNLLQASLDDYVSTRSSASMEEYYTYAEELEYEAESLNNVTTDSQVLLAEKNIRGLCESYLSLAEETIEAKRGRNVERYGELSDQLTDLGDEIHTYIYSLNNELFKENSQNYTQMNGAIRNSETFDIFFLIFIILGNMLLISFSTAAVIQPLNKLAEAANEVSAGNFDLEELKVESGDEVGVVTGAFNQMVGNIRNYIDELQNTMERENALKARDLMMQSSLKEAQLRYLQAQINPHFLFNTLNAGAQLAMMEDATRTEQLLTNAAAFFRYNVRNLEDATLEEEITLVDNYIYICNVRFPEEIIFEKDIDETVTEVRLPSMILQPLVENAFNYGIRNIGREGRIELCVFRREDRIMISVWDNGNGMTAERIDEVLHAANPKPDPRSNSSNGVGVRNLRDRLELYFNGDATLDIRSEGEGMGTEVIISIPNKERRQSRLR